MSTSLRLLTFHGAAQAPWLDAVAALRIAVFREWPYLYDGDVVYEAEYLRRYVDAPDSIFVLALNGDDVVGASTGLPLAQESAALRTPLERAGFDPGQVFYCGESVLLPPWRGRGIGHAFFDAREAHARRLGLQTSAFCAVERADDDQRRPPDVRSNHAFWRGRGYVQHADIVAELDWKEVGTDAELPHRLSYWTRSVRQESAE